MSLSTSANRRRLLTAISLLALGAFFMTNPLTNLLYKGSNESVLSISLRGFAAPIHMALLVGSVIGITQLLRDKADKRGLAGGALVVIGWAVGIRILAISQIDSLVSTGLTRVPPDAFARMFEGAPMVWVSLVPIGILFPIGLITLGLTIAATAPIPRWIGVLLAIGGALFPIGRIGSVPWALIGCDLVLGTSLALIGWQILKRRELWPEPVPAGDVRQLRPSP